MKIPLKDLDKLDEVLTRPRGGKSKEQKKFRPKHGVKSYQNQNG